MSLASHACRRFGLGPRPGDLVRVAGDPRGFVLDQLSRPTAAIITDAALRPGAELHMAHQRHYANAQEAERKRLAAPRAAMQPQTGPAPQPNPMNGGLMPPTAGANLAASPPALPYNFKPEAAARLGQANTTETPLLERLVHFWSNHFCVTTQKGYGTLVLTPPYEREVIRPHALGRFADMLKAVMQHPAMLLYLDNVASVGPNSPAGKKNKQGLNENLAREILELHTLGVAGGYSQDDVRNLARLLTGWGVSDLEQGDAISGLFRFRADQHEPGHWAVLGKTYTDDGQARGLAALDDFARHPSTARHLARKFVRHFVGEDAPQALIDRVASAFRDSDGDLATMTRTLVQADEAWQRPAQQILPPCAWLIAITRGLGWRPSVDEALNIMTGLGQPLWAVQHPAGWSDTNAAWTAPASIRERLRIAEHVACALDRRLDARHLGDDLFGAAASSETQSEISRAEHREQALALLMMAPEFQRR